MPPEKLGQPMETTFETRESSEKMAGLEQRVLLVRDLHREIMSTRADLSVEEVEVKFEVFWAGLLARVPKEAQETFSEYLLIEKKRADLLVEIREEGDADLEDEGVDELFNRMSEVENLIDEMTKDPEINFLVESRKTIDGLLGKYKEVRKLAKKDLKKLIIGFLQKRKGKKKLPLNSEAVGEVRFNAFDVSVFLQDEDFDSLLGGGKSGVHFSGSPMIFVRLDGSSEPEETYRHEAVHNFLDSSGEFSTFSLKGWIGDLETYLKFKKMNAPEVILDHKKKSLQRFGAEEILNKLHNEILAALEEFESSEFKGYGLYKEETDLISQIFKREKPPNVFFQIFDLATAQVQALQVMETIGEVLKKTDDDFLREYLGKISEEFTKGFSVMAEQIKTALEIGRRLGIEADEFAHFSLVLLKPSQFGLAEVLLRKRYGGAAVERVQKVSELVNMSGFSFETAVKISEIVEKDPDSFETIDLEKIIERFSSLQVGYDHRVQFRSLEKLRKFVGLMEKFSAFAISRGVTVEKVFSGISSAQKDHFISQLEVSYYYKGLLSEWSTLKPEELEALGKALVERVENIWAIGELFEDSDREDYTLVDVENSDFWQVVKLAGVEEKIRPLIKAKL